MTPARRLRTQDEEVEAEKAPEGILRNELNQQIKPKSKTENNKSYICRANKIKPNRLVRSSSQGGQSREATSVWKLLLDKLIAKHSSWTGVPGRS